MYTISDRIGASKTDGRGALKLTAAIDMLQDCSMFWMESEPRFSQYLEENRLGMFLAFRQVDVARMPRYGEEVAVTTSIFGCKGYMGYRNTVLRDSAGKPCVLSWSVGAFVDLASGRAARLPGEVMDGVAYSPKVEMEYLDRRIKLPEGEGSALPPIPVRRVDIDLNGHVNNVKYIEYAAELLPEDAAVGRLRVEYKRPAKGGDLLYPRMLHRDSGAALVSLEDGEGRPYAVVEFHLEGKD